MSLLLASFTNVKELAWAVGALIVLELFADRLALVVVLASTLLSSARVTTFAGWLALAFPLAFLATLPCAPGSVHETCILPSPDSLPGELLTAGRTSSFKSVALASGGRSGRGDEEKLLEEADVLHDLIGGCRKGLVLSHVHAKSPIGCIPCCLDDLKLFVLVACHPVEKLHP